MRGIGKRRFTIRPGGHIICTLTISALVYLVFRSSMAFFLSLISGVLIDIDHILDYYLQEGITLRIRNIYIWSRDIKYRFVFLVFHSLELVILLWVVIGLFKLGLAWIAFTIGLTQHMLLDVFFNRQTYSYTYFLSYRIIKGFKKEHLFRKGTFPGS